MNTNGTNGSNGQAAQVQISPVEAAQYALTFLGRASFTRHERHAFDVAEALLNAIVQGQVTVTTARAQQQLADPHVSPPA